MVEQVEIKTEETSSEKPEETTQQTPETKPERPDWLPEKFASAEDMAKAYGELEKKQSQAEAPKVEEKQETPKPQENDLEIEKAAEDAVASAGLNMETLQEEYDSTGELTDKSYDALAKAGVSREYVDAFIAGQQAIADQISNSVKATVGGNENYAEIVNWAKANLSAQEQNAYNNAVNSNDLSTVQLAVAGLQSRYQAANGTDPKLVSGTASSDVGNGYQSWAQVTEAMNDPRYAKDAAYRTEVQKKIGASKL